MSETTLPSAGWYPSPTAPGALQYWDGKAWTSHVHQPPVSTAPAADPQSVGKQTGHRRGSSRPSGRPSRKERILTLAGGALILLAAVLVSSGHLDASNASAMHATQAEFFPITKYSGEDPVAMQCQIWNQLQGMSESDCLAKLAAQESAYQADLHKAHLKAGFGWVLGVLGVGLLVWGLFSSLKAGYGQRGDVTG